MGPELGARTAVWGLRKTSDSARGFPGTWAAVGALVCAGPAVGPEIWSGVGHVHGLRLGFLLVLRLNIDWGWGCVGLRR